MASPGIGQPEWTYHEDVKILELFYPLVRQTMIYLRSRLGHITPGDGGYPPDKDLSDYNTLGKAFNDFVFRVAGMHRHIQVRMKFRFWFSVDHLSNSLYRREESLVETRICCAVIGEANWCCRPLPIPSREDISPHLRRQFISSALTRFITSIEYISSLLHCCQRVLILVRRFGEGQGLG